MEFLEEKFRETLRDALTSMVRMCTYSTTDSRIARFSSLVIVTIQLSVAWMRISDHVCIFFWIRDHVCIDLLKMIYNFKHVILHSRPSWVEIIKQIRFIWWLSLILESNHLCCVSRYLSTYLKTQGLYRNGFILDTNLHISTWNMNILATNWV